MRIKSKSRSIFTILFSGLIIILGLIIAFAAYDNDKKGEEDIEGTEVLPENIVEMRADQIALAEIETGFIEMRMISSTLKVSGIVTVAPQNMATVCAPMGGFIKSISLLPGNAVSKGQTLAIIENQEFVDIQQNYLEAKARFEFAEAEFKRHSELYEEDVYSKKNHQEITANYKTLKSLVSALEQKLSLVGIKASDLHEDDISSTVALISPITGYIKTVNVNLGKSISSTDVLFEIVNTDHLLLELTLFEKDAGKVAKGQKIRFFINNETDQHEAVIYQTGRMINADKTYKVYASVPGFCANVLPGMYVNAIIETSDKKVASVPSDAVVNFDGKDYIFVFEKNKEEDGKPFAEYCILEVKKGLTDGSFTEIFLPEGIDIASAKVVIKGAYNLLSAKKNAGEMAC